MAKVLLVDDDFHERELYRALLYYNGFEVAVAEDAKAGVEAAIKEQPDVILIDVMMPGMNGLTAANSIHTNPSTSHIPIYCMSAYDVSLHRVREAGALDFLRKPVGGQTLVHVIRRHIARDLSGTGQPQRRKRIRVFEVVREQSGWVVRDNIGLYLARHRNRDDAVKDGHRVAPEARPCELIVKAEDGQITYHATFPEEGPSVIHVD
jgi:CheY-like chemotaxis protein